MDASGWLGFFSESPVAGERPGCGEGEVEGEVDCRLCAAGRASRSDGLSFEGRRVKGGGEFA